MKDAEVEAAIIRYLLFNITCHMYISCGQTVTGKEINEPVLVSSSSGTQTWTLPIEKLREAHDGILEED